MVRAIPSNLRGRARDCPGQGMHCARRRRGVRGPLDVRAAAHAAPHRALVTGEARRHSALARRTRHRGLRALSVATATGATDTSQGELPARATPAAGAEPQPPKGPLPAISLPKGGGAIRGIGEKLAVDALTGTGTVSIPLPVTPGRNGFGPQLTLTYDSTAGNGPFGLGWSLGLPAITRRTDKGLPRYRDEEESDVFILSGAEDLVPVLVAGQPSRVTRTVHGVQYEVAAYRPRVEALFARIERWTERASGISHWRSITRDNVTTLYGTDAASRIADPEDARRIFSWLISRTFDDKGNLCVYGYVAEDGSGVDSSLAHESNRTDDARVAQRYVKSIRYANATPYFADWSTDGAETPLPADWHLEVVFDYGDHATDAPTPAPDQPWALRPDPFSLYKAGFEVRTYRRVARVLLFHHFPSEAVGENALIRTLEIAYSDEEAPADPRNPIYTVPRSLTSAGFRRVEDGYVERALPPLELTYSEPEIQPDVLTLDLESAANLPEGLDGSRYRWVDLDGEGLPGILSDHSGGWGYKRNLSPLEEDGPRARFGPLEAVESLPSRSSLGTDTDLQFLDLSGNGRPDLVALSEPTPGFFERTEDESWSPFHGFDSLPRIDWSDPNLKLVDVTGDGLADVLITQDEVYTYYPSLGAEGFGEGELVRQPWDETRGPTAVFADGTNTVFLADMSGDGRSDIVRVRNGEVCYWPDLGYGRFGPKVTMDGAPRYADDAAFDPRRLRLADVDGSGTTDLLYLGDEGVDVYFNRSGNSWAEPHRVAIFPTSGDSSSVQALDLLGNGTTCLVWSSGLPGERSAPLRYVDLMGGQKPHLLLRVVNNLGAETRLTYAPSTRFYLADKLAGTPWITRLPFPVQVVERMEAYDWIGRSRFVTRYAYHHGYFDGFEREFRGFGKVEQWDTEEHRADTSFPDAENLDESSWTPPLRTCTWFHTGASTDPAAVSRQYAHEYWVEPALRPGARAADREAMLLPDSVLPGGLTPAETREAYRALKGSALRTEVYGEDGSPLAGNPYTVTEQSFEVSMLQPAGPNRHAVFFAHPREVLSFQYERAPDDPRVTHDVTLEVDDYGDVLRRVSIGYPRRPGFPEPEPTLSAAYRAMLAHDQARLHVAATETSYTNAFVDPAVTPDLHRTPAAAETIVAELTGFAPASNRAGITNLFGFAEIDGRWAEAWDGAHDVPYEEIPEGDIDGTAPPPSVPTRRIVERKRILYRRDDLTALLSYGELEPAALPGESYQLALTPGLVSRIFDNSVPDGMLVEGGYVHLGDTDWWIPSGRTFYSAGDADTPAQELAEARAHFFVIRRAVDAFGGIARASYDAYDLLPASATDPVGNTSSADNDYRLLVPFRTTDPNGNRVEAALDALGFVVGTASMGKVTQSLGDSLADFDPEPDDATSQAHFADPLADPGALLGIASTRTLYDLFAYRRTRADAQPAPAVLCTITRETHVSELATGEATRYQHAFAYSDGLGREIQRKVLAEPGRVVEDGPVVSPRWVGSGWAIRNNKGKPVRRYEPFFSATHRFEFAATAGVSSVLFYDPAQRQVATLHPDSNWEKVVFDAWRQETWDANDTVSVSDPRDDPDVGDHFRRHLGTGTFVSWHDARSGGALGAAEQDAATKAEVHAETPTLVHLDARGRICLRIADNGAGGRAPSRIALDPESKQLAVFDALGRRAFEFCRREAQAGGGFRYIAGYDLTGHNLYRNGADDGERRSLADALADPFRTWDARGNAIRVVRDAARRQTHRYVATNGDPEILIERSFFGEGHADRNLCGRLHRHYDGAGVVANERYDFKGNLVETGRHLANAYRTSPDWRPIAASADANAAEATAAALLSPEGPFTSTTVYDALNRAIQVMMPARAGMRPSVFRTTYNEANLPERIDVWLRQASAPAGLLDPAGADLHAVTDFDYNARGQTVAIAYGNGAVTMQEHDPLTFRLSRLTTTRPSSFGANERVVQDLAFAYDPVGNVTRIDDSADTQNAVFFRNRRVDPTRNYAYDALYRLVSARGREHLGQNGGGLAAGVQVSNDDSARTSLPHPGDGNAMGTYVETYDYDLVGNLLSVVHQVSSGSWTRRYAYDEPSAIAPAETCNRLSETSLPGDAPAGPFSATYGYDAGGNLRRMPHLPSLGWDELGRLRATTRQVVGSGTPETTFASYDPTDARVRKTTDRQAAAGQEPTRRTERLYLGPIELYREYGPDGTTVKLERETVHVGAGGTRVALVETRTVGTDPAPAQLVRYQCGDHCGSCALELDAAAAIVSYEEYFPYGSTSYQAVRSATETPKRYRYTGKERDEESDLAYHGARYYAPWLGRWTSPDPKPEGHGGPNLYAYVLDNPVKYIDPEGRDARISVDQKTHTITYSTTVHFYGTAAEIKKVTPLAKEAERFYKTPTIETGAQTQARFVKGGQAPTGGNTFTDPSGTKWTVKFDVKYQLHDVAKTAPVMTAAGTTVTGAGVTKDPATVNDFVTNLPKIETDLKKSIGFNPGDNIMTLRPPSGSTGGITHLFSTADAGAPTFGRPESRMLAEVARGNTTDITRESIIHETGHLLGFDERYDGRSLVQNHNDFGWDLMSSAGGKGLDATTMHPTHIEDAARFAIGVANGRTLVDQTIRGIRIDDTGTQGRTQMIVGGATNPAYTTRQTTLSTELTPFFRAQAGTAGPLPSPAPVPAPAPAPKPRLVPAQ
jgi:RHS repeat-associated protein